MEIMRCSLGEEPRLSQGINLKCVEISGEKLANGGSYATPWYVAQKFAQHFSILNEQTKEWKNPFSENIGVQPNDNWECVFNRVKGETSISGVENKMIVITRIGEGDNGCLSTDISTEF